MFKSHTKTIGLCALLSLSSVDVSAACNNLIGKWRITYTLKGSIFNDTLTIQSVNQSGLMSGKDQYGVAIRGFCKNNTVHMMEIRGNDTLLGWYFTTVLPRFARFSPVLCFEADCSSTRLDNALYAATVAKISNSTLAKVVNPQTLQQEREFKVALLRESAK